MIRGIDHLVIACGDPDAAAAALEADVGLVCAGGGRHVGRGTFNRIAWLADGSYLELIGIEDGQLASADPVGAAAMRCLDDGGGGLATYALRVEDLEATASRLRAQGSPVGPVTHGSRVRDDGDLVQWWTAFPDRPLAPAAAPFLIEHAYTGAEWGHDALAERARFAHPIGSPVLLARLDIAAADPASVAAELHQDLALDRWAVADRAVANVGPHVLRFVPRREMPVPAVITLRADVDAPRTVGLLGLHFDVEPVELPLPAPNRA